MKTIKMRPAFLIFILFFVFLTTHSAKADIREYVETEFQTSGGYTGNLLADSSNVADSYGLAKASVRAYPFPMMEILLNGEYTNYGNYVDLTNFSGGGGITIIPLKETSPFSVYFNGNFNSRGYRENFKSFNTRIIDGIASLGYSVTSTMQLRAGFAYKSTSYINDETIDNSSYALFGGGNVTFLGSNSFDIETGYAIMNLTYWERDVWKVDYGSWPDTFYYVEPDNVDKYPSRDGRLISFNISPRYSRPIGDKIGFSLTYSYRKFNDLGEIAVAGVSTQSLSPWISVYEGESVSLKIKTYMVPNFTLSLGAGYWKKDYLRANELKETGPYFVIKDRHDEQNRIFFSIQRPFPSKSGLFIKPTLQINYTHNNSSNELYDYSNFSITGGLTFRY